MSFAANFLAKQTSLQDRLIAEPSQIDNFVDEALRLFGVANVPRLVTRDVERLGVKFHAGEMVLCALPMAGWDDRKNADPAVFSLDRQDRKHLTFGTGTHLCLGRFLARTELKKIFSEWLSTIGRFRLSHGEQTHFWAGTIMSLDHLNLEWDAASA
jgi:cytochrome P450